MSNDDALGTTRREYSSGALRRQDLAALPGDQFAQWLARAVAYDLTDATAFALATADAAGIPAVRIVLLKGHAADRYTFYTDYRSRKGHDLAANPVAEMLFYWREQERQVRIQGSVEFAAEALSREYFASRPRPSQVSAAASVQSAPVQDRTSLEARAKAVEDAAAGGEIVKPAAWGGYVLTARRYEFWQGRAGRLHDRFEYVRGPDGSWAVARLQP